MECEVIEQAKDKLRVRIIGADRTILNILVKELQSGKSVKSAAYKIEHPLKGVPELVIETDGKQEPKTALLNAISSLKQKYDAFNKDFSKAFA